MKQTILQGFLVAGLVTSLMLLVIGLGGIQMDVKHQPTASKMPILPTPGLAGQNIPIYPGARQTEPPTSLRRPDLTAFVTPDSGESVLAYYTSTLEKSGWTLYKEWGSHSIEYH